MTTTIDGSAVSTFAAGVTCTALNGGQLGGFRNRFINGELLVWQRGTSIAFNASTATYTADRWGALGTGAKTVTRQTGENAQYALRLQRNNTETGTSAMAIATALETSDIVPLRGTKVTVSFRMRKGANYSGGDVSVNLFTGTATESIRDFTAGYTGEANIGGTIASATISTSFVDYSITSSAVVASNATQMTLGIQYSPTGTAGANDWIEVEQIQLEEGSVATPFEHRSYGTELALCQRYYEKFDVGTIVTTTSGSSYGAVGSYKVEKRAVASITLVLSVGTHGFPGTLGTSYTNTVNAINYYLGATATQHGSAFTHTLAASAEL